MPGAGLDTSQRSQWNYDSPLVETFNLGSFDYGTASAVKAVDLPAGCRFARIINVQGLVTEAFACDTTAATFVCGITGGDVDKFMIFTFPDATAINTTYSLRDTGITPFSAATYDYSDFGYGVIDMNTAGTSSAALTELAFLPVVGVDSGTEAGIATMMVTMGWW